MPNEYTLTTHSGAGPSDLRVADPRPVAVATDAATSLRAYLDARPDLDDIAHMLFDPIKSGQVKQSHRKKTAA